MKERLKRFLMNENIEPMDRELHKLSESLDINIRDIGYLMEELFSQDIVDIKVQYICANCLSTTLVDFNDIDGGLINWSFCNDCGQTYCEEYSKTGYAYYDIVDFELLREWT